MSENLDQTSLDALLHASPEQLQEALQLQQGGQATQDQQQLLQAAQQASTDGGEQTNANVPVERNINMVSGQSAAPISLSVAMLNSLNAMESWLAMVPDGQAKHGMRAEIVNMREMLA